MTTRKYQYTYFAYGLTISSQFSIFGFPEIISEHPDVIIKQGQTPIHLLDVRNQNKYYQSNGEEYLLCVKGIANYYISRGNIITIQPEINAELDRISAYLGGMVMGALFHQRGLFPMHASSVVYKGQCLIFAGDAGSGKSTLAATLVKSGAKLVADDISLIGFLDNHPVIYPSIPYIKVWQHDLTQLKISMENLQKVPLENEKYYYTSPQFDNITNTVDKIFIIERQKKLTLESNALHGMEKFHYVKNCSYLSTSLNNTQREKLHFKMISNLAEKIPVILLSRPESAFPVDHLKSAILDFLD